MPTEAEIPKFENYYTCAFCAFEYEVLSYDAVFDHMKKYHLTRVHVGLSPDKKYNLESCLYKEVRFLGLSRIVE